MKTTAARFSMMTMDTYSVVSPSELGRVQLSKLQQKNDAYTVFAPSAGDEESVLTVMEQQNLLLNPPEGTTITEGYLCMKMTRYLQRLFRDDNVLLVNSEENKWIVTLFEHPDNFMKPDFFLIRKGLQADRPETGSKALRNLRKLAENSDVPYSFGVLSDWRIRDCIVAIIEFKMKLTEEDFGKLMCYLQHLSRNDDESTYYGMVCDNTDVWLVSCSRGEATFRIDTKWTTPGSAQCIRNFFKRNNWCKLLDKCLADFKVTLSESNSFLGCGSFGRVFSVITEDGSQHALKIVYSKEDKALTGVQSEVAALRSIKSIGGHTVTVRNEPVYWMDPATRKISGIGYMMAEVGTAIQSEKKFRGELVLMEEVFRELCHLHTLRRYHGDPRLPNIIRYNGNLLWIDFMRANIEVTNDFDFQEIVKHDVNTLLQSIFGQTHNSNEILSALNSYATAPSEATIVPLIKAILRWAV